MSPGEKALEILVKISTIILMVILYPVGLFCLILFFVELHFGALFGALFCLIFPSLLYYIVFYQPKKKVHNEFDKATQFYNAIQEAFKTLNAVSDEEFKTISIENNHYRPVGNETYISQQPNVGLLEIVNTGRILMDDVSLKEYRSSNIHKASHYTVNNSAMTLEKQQMTTSQGRLVLTTQALVFEGDKKSLRVDWNEISHIEIFLNGIVVHKRNGVPNKYSIAGFNPYNAAIMMKMLQ